MFHQSIPSRDPDRLSTLEYLSTDRLAASGAALGARETLVLPARLLDDPARRNRENGRVIRDVYRDTLKVSLGNRLMTPAAEWLIDNVHLVDETMRLVGESLPPRFYRQLPALGAEGHGKDGSVPRVLVFAWRYNVHSHFDFAVERLSAMVEGYQGERVLQIGELWAIPAALRFVLLDELTEVARQIARARTMRERADAVADRLILSEDRASHAVLFDTHSDDTGDDTFASHLLYRLRDAPVASQDAVEWIETALEARDSDADEVLIIEQARQSAANVLIGNIIRSLRSIDDVAWSDWFSEHSRVDQLLVRETIFGALDFASQDQYRGAIEVLSRQSGLTEIAVTERVIEMCPHRGSDDPLPCDVGRWLIGPGRPDFERGIGARPAPVARVQRFVRRMGWWSIAAPVGLLTLAIVIAVLVGLGLSKPSVATAIALLLLAALPVAEAAIGVFNTAVGMLVKPTRLPGYAFEEGVPEDAATLVVVPCLLMSRDSVDDLCRNLEVHYLADAKGHLSFALLSDWTDSAEERTEADDAILAYAQERIDALAARYGHGGRRRFFLLHRRRVFNPSEGVWMGWERKRGKLEELNMMLRGEVDTTFLPPKAMPPQGITYVMTLDSDTRVTRNAVTRLVGKLHHPLNHPTLAPGGRKVASGYGILQPRVTPSLTTGSDASLFQRVFSRNRGVDPYVFTVSDTYQDMTGEGSFTGKGLYHVDTFRAVLDGTFDENAVLSHDLVEGAFARCALVTDVELIEDFPIRYDAEAGRQHRWARGDVQLLPMIFGNRRLDALARWKMVDNIRRLLLPVAWVAASALGWFVFETPGALWWQAFLVLSLFVAPTLSLLRSSMPPRYEVVLAGHLRATGEDAASASAQVLLRVVLMADQAVLMSDALVRTLYRTFVSHRNLLEWRSAAMDMAGPVPTLGHYYRRMWVSVALSAVLLVVVAALAPGWVVGCAFCVAWIAAPAIAWRVSQSAETDDRLSVTRPDSDALRRVARRTWTFFETFVTEEHHWLPPDNFQEHPAPVTAPRTSPTNIGLYLLASVSARDFGWISFGDATDRIERTLGTVARMQKHHGHLLNWYETTTLEPLQPRYVSSVDSGNLAGHLIALSATLKDWASTPFVHLWVGVDGILDTAQIVREELAALPDDRRSVRPLRRRVEERLDGFCNTLRGLARQPELASVRVLSLAVAAEDIVKLTGELDRERDVDESQVSLWAVRLKRVCDQIVADATIQPTATEELRVRLARAAVTARRLAFEMDFGVLLNPDRRLLSIGMSLEEGKLDTSCYDLLASEARLTVLFAIAKGDLTTECWFRLGRPVTAVGGRGALMSWSGSMFEYLMPPLVMQERSGGILNQSNALSVARQIAYGRERGVPWGISEAALNARDREMTYQYSNFGVPSLGLKRGLASDLVIAPYASVLASQYDPRAAVRNLERLARIGARGVHGFYDAVDFTPARLPEGASHAVVRNYMAHHQGMSILAVSNVVFEGRLRERFHSDPVIEAAELLLQEKAPRDIPKMASTLPANERLEGRAELSRGARRVIRNPGSGRQGVGLLSNGHYALCLTATGGGQATWNRLAVTRFRPDPVEDVWGNFVFLRDMDDGAWWSATAAPRRAPHETSFAVFSDSKAEFHKTVGTLTTRLDVIVASESDGEGRCLTLRNDGDTDRLIEVTSYAEPVLSRADADAAHPAFSKMFLRTEIDAEAGAIHVWRNRRRPDEPDIHVVHMMSGAELRGIEAETDRRAFVGRGRRLDRAAAFDPGARLTGTDGFTLDPIVSLRRQVRVPAGREVRVVFWTLAAPDRATAEVAMAKYRHPESFAREAMHAWTRSQIQLRHIGVSPEEATVFQRLARHLVLPGDALKTADAGPGAAQSALWPMAISGDVPIVLLRIDDEADLGIVRKALRGYEYLRARDLQIDLVILNEHASSYSQDLQRAIEEICSAARHRGTLTAAGEHVFTLRRDQIDSAAFEMLLATARATFHARNGKLSTQMRRIDRAAARPSRPGAALSPPPSPAVADPVTGGDLAFWNGFGGFDTASGEYVVRRSADAPVTPHPWINVIANRNFGFHVSSEGAGYAWSVNSRDHQLTPWSNDPVVDRPGEGVWLVCRDTGVVRSPLPALDATSARMETRHAPGRTRFLRAGDGLKTELAQWVDAEAPVRVSRLTLTNEGDAPLRLRLYVYAEWVLGVSREKTAPHVTVERAAAGRALVARNPFSVEFPGQFAFLACDRPAGSVSASRAAFLGTGDVWTPGAVAAGTGLDDSLRTFGDPSAAIAVDIDIAPGTSEEVDLLLGAGEGDADIGALVDAHLAGAARRDWAPFLDTVQIETPDPAMDLMVNTWLPYQGVACRLTARSAFYQASGAFGFRDQLQDTLAFLLHDPSMAREQILRAAGRQFPEGDVQHWWLPRTGAGVRTMISDDVVWLSHATAHYMDVTGDIGILDEEIAFLEGPTLEPGQHDAYLQPETSDRRASLFEHAALALDLAIRRTGANGFPLILGGDWNDGMNMVGEEGRGESVWLGWFLAGTLARWIDIARARGDAARAEAWSAHLSALKAALDGPGWDGTHYRRGFYDDGTPLGSEDSDECRIDSIAQSWSVLSGEGNPERSAQAMQSVLDRLVDEEAGLIRLFVPPFERTEKNPGYIKGYPPGVRENGGQYTHAATWVVYALAEMGRGDDAHRCFAMLNPITHGADRSEAERYRTEPYAVAADVYSEGSRAGRGGWTWYTGSAGWLYRAGVEGVLGIRRRGDRLFVRPAIPADWPGFAATLTLDGKRYRIEVTREGGAPRATCNGTPADAEGSFAL